MARKHILFLSWQGGMGHITRDIAIAKELRVQNPDVDIVWMAHPLATKELQQAGENLLHESQSSADYNQISIPIVTNFSLNLMKYVWLSKKSFAHNVHIFKQVISKHSYDLIIGDESFEVVLGLKNKQINLNCPMILIEDFLGLEAMTKNPIERIGVYHFNRSIVNNVPLLIEQGMTRLLVGDLEDVPDKPFGFLLPNRREFAKKYYYFLGYIIRFDPSDYANKAGIRSKLGYGKEPLIICATGGTAAGKELLEICGKAYTIIKKDIQDLKMICVCGELYGLTPPNLPEGVELKSYLPDIYEHYAACDFAVVVGGGTTTGELTALRCPFIYFPLEKQFDQQIYIAERLKRHGAGIKMRYFETTPESLSQTIIENIGKDMKWTQIPIDGAKKAARIINNILFNAHDALV